MSSSESRSSRSGSRSSRSSSSRCLAGTDSRSVSSDSSRSVRSTVSGQSAGSEGSRSYSGSYSGSRSSRGSESSDYSEGYYGCYYDFHIADGTLRCVDDQQRIVQIEKLSDIQWFAQLDPSGEVTSSQLYLQTSDQVLESVEEWTEFFIDEPRIVLKPPFDCANHLEEREEEDCVYVLADCLFPYISTIQNRSVTGKLRESSDDDPYELVHLDPSLEKMDLEMGVLYFIGSNHEGHFAGLDRLCQICWERHDLLCVPCPKAQHFVATGGGEDLKRKLELTCTGARVLCVRPSGDSLFNTSMSRQWLCVHCEKKAAAERRVWYELDRYCSDEECLNHVLCCMHRIVGCRHYVYVSSGVEHNLSSYDIPRAVEEGHLHAVMGAGVHETAVRRIAYQARKLTHEAFKNGTRITVDDILQQLGLILPEFLVVAMYDTRVADYIDGNKSFTLNKINGSVENAKPVEVGPWLIGRIVEGLGGKMWHLPTGKAVTITTSDAVSHVKEWRESHGKSDLLGQFVG